jgi:hypothetical protein
MHYCQLYLALVLCYAEYPNCTETDFFVTSEDSVFVRPSDFSELGAVAEDCIDHGCQASSTFRVNSSASCSNICARIPACDWWSSLWTVATPLINRTICHLFSTKGSTMVKGVKHESAVSGHKSCSLNVWPNCVLLNSFIPNTGFTELWINAVTVFALPGNDDLCHQGNCNLTDSIPVSSVEKCASLCGRMEKCHSWSTTSEENSRLKCWFRRHVVKIVERKGAASGDSVCGNHSPYEPLNFQTVNS